MNNNNQHIDLIATRKLAYDLNNFKCSEAIPEPENSKYGAYSFKVNDLNIRFRVGKTTPTKIGQFVTFWKRIANEPTQLHILIM